jgi:hypothetical protein
MSSTNHYLLGIVRLYFVFTFHFDLNFENVRRHCAPIHGKAIRYNWLQLFFAHLLNYWFRNLQKVFTVLMVYLLCQICNWSWDVNAHKWGDISCFLYEGLFITTSNVDPKPWLLFICFPRDGYEDNVAVLQSY